MNIVTTRSTVLGHIDRAKKAGRVAGRNGTVVVFRRPPSQSLRQPAKPKEPRRPAIPPPDPIGPMNDFPKAPDAEHGACRFIHGDPPTGNWRCCGAPTKSITEPWCDAHWVVCHQGSKIGTNTNGEEANGPESGELSGSQAKQSAA